LKNLVEQEPRQVGKPFSVWTCLDLAKELAEKKLADVCAETVRRHLRKLHYRVIRPVLSINSPDPDYQIKAEHLEQCQKQARQGEMILLYEDEVDLNLLPGVIRCWTKCGKQRKILTPGQNQKRYGFGAVNFITGQMTYRVGERKNSDGFCALVEQIVADYCPGETYQGPKIGLVVDNYIIHRSKKTLACLEKYTDRLEIIPLPTYAPKLNLIELLWKYLRRKVTHNHLFETMAKLIEAVEDFLKSLNEHRVVILSVIGCSG
jgi:DDE superfamily endonuclease